MVGKRRLNKRRRIGTLRVTRSRKARRESPFSDLPFKGSAALRQKLLSHENLNQARIPASSMGRRSDCQSRNTPPTRKTKSASQTPAAGERCPCLAKETPIKEIE